MQFSITDWLKAVFEDLKSKKNNPKQDLIPPNIFMIWTISLSSSCSSVDLDG